MKQLAVAVAALGIAAPLVAGAEVKASAADGFLIEHKLNIAATPEAAWKVLLRPERWWPAAHTWSGDPRHLSLQAQAGGCFCERWNGSSVLHARVIHLRPGQLLRLEGALGPLQDLAVTGVLTVRLTAEGDGSVATVSYRVSGDASHQLESLAPVVDRVIGEQFGRFAALASGTPPGGYSR